MSDKTEGNVEEDKSEILNNLNFPKKELVANPLLEDINRSRKEEGNIEQKKSEISNISNFPRKEFIANLLLEDINRRRKEMSLREKSMLTILTAYLGALFVVIEFVFVQGNRSVFLLIPAFLASGVALILHQERIIYSLAAYICMREEDINSIIIMPPEEEINYSLDKYQLRYETLYHKFSSGWILITDMVLMFITFFPILLVFLWSLIYLYQNYGHNWPILSTIASELPLCLIENKFLILFGIYIALFLIIVRIFIFLGDRTFYEKAKNKFKNLI
jgi:hypothetical protein